MPRGKKKTFVSRSGGSGRKRAHDGDDNSAAEPVDDSVYRSAEKQSVPAKMPKYLPLFYNFVEHKGNDALKQECHWNMDEHKALAEYHWPLFAETGKPKAPKVKKPKTSHESKKGRHEDHEELDEGMEGDVEQEMVQLSANAREQYKTDIDNHEGNNDDTAIEHHQKEQTESNQSSPKGNGDIRKHFKSVRDRVRDVARKGEPLDMQTAKEILDNLRALEKMVQGDLRSP